MHIIVRSSEFGVRSSEFGQTTRLTRSRRERGVELVGCAGAKRGALRSRPEFGV